MENIIRSKDVTQNLSMDSVKSGDNINELEAEVIRGNKNNNNFELSLGKIDMNKGDLAVDRAMHECDVKIVRENEIDNKDSEAAMQEFSNKIKENDDASEMNEISLKMNGVKCDNIDNEISSGDIQNEKFNQVVAGVSASENAEYIVGAQMETTEPEDDTVGAVDNTAAAVEENEEKVDDAPVRDKASQPNIIDNPLDMISNFMNDVETEAVQAMGTLRRELNRIMHCLNFIRENADDE